MARAKSLAAAQPAPVLSAVTVSIFPECSSNVGGNSHTSLEVADVGGPLNVIACAGKTSIPLSGGRSALHQHQNGLIEIDNQATDGDEVQEPFSLGMRPVLNAEEECTNGHFAKSDAVQYHDLAEPGPFHGNYKLGGRELVHVVGESRVRG